MIKQALFGVLCLLSLGATGQVDSTAKPVVKDSLELFTINHRGQILEATIIDGDTVPWMVLDEVLLIDEPTFDSHQARRRYFFLKRKVMRVYPYAVLAANRLDSLNLRLDKITSRRSRNRHIRDYSDFLEDRFEPELRKLTRSEGQILCKLIYRETGITVFDLISEYRSGWTAFWWNVNANWYDISLKMPYDPSTSEEDKLIEQILRRSFTQGLLEERVPFYPPPTQEE